MICRRNAARGAAHNAARNAAHGADAARNAAHGAATGGDASRSSNTQPGRRHTGGTPRLTVQHPSSTHGNLGTQGRKCGQNRYEAHGSSVAPVGPSSTSVLGTSVHTPNLGNLET